jgi:hypothetical protein
MSCPSHSVGKYQADQKVERIKGRHGPDDAQQRPCRSYEVQSTAFRFPMRHQVMWPEGAKSLPFLGHVVPLIPIRRPLLANFAPAVQRGSCLIAQRSRTIRLLIFHSQRE